MINNTVVEQGFPTAGAVLWQSNLLSLYLKSLVFAVLLSVPFGAVKAGIYTLPLDSCDLVLDECDWNPLNPINPNPGGDVWIDFESAAGAGDMAHFEVSPGDQLDFFTRFDGDFGLLDPISGATGAPEITVTEMGGIPVDRSKYEVITTLLINGNTALGFGLRFFDSVFVHGIHLDCIVDSVGTAAGPQPCSDTTNRGLTSMNLSPGTGNDTELVTGVWPRPVPVPAALWLFASALLGLAGYQGRRQRS